MLLSILIPGKNDNFRANTKKVLELNLNRTIANINELETNDIELILCDWGSENKIIESIELEKTNNFTCVYVPPDITKKYNGQGSYSIVHPINTAFRNSSGKYVIFWDSDCYTPLSTFTELYKFVKKMDETNDMSFYWGSRYNLAYDIYSSFDSYKQLDKYLETNIVYNHDKISLQNFRGCSISMLMNRELWENSTGWYEALIYWGWQDIEFHHRLLYRYKFGGDLENHDMKFYHMLSKPSDSSATSLKNPWLNANSFRANSDSWGLKEETLEIIKSI